MGKELVWVVQPDCHVDYCSSTDPTATLYKALGAQPFNYTDAVDALPNSIKAFGAHVDGGEFITGGQLESAAALEVTGAAASGAWAGVGDNNNSGVSDAGTFV